jgi:hypothetical protein
MQYLMQAWRLQIASGVNTLRMGDADLRLYAYKQFKYPVPSVLILSNSVCG